LHKGGYASPTNPVEFYTILERNTVGATARNKRFSEMAVGVEPSSLLRPLTSCDSSGPCAPNPPLRQAAGRYVKFTLLWCEIVGELLKEA